MLEVLDEFDDEEPIDESFDVDDEQDGEDLIACPRCGTEIYGDAQQCPLCGHWILDSERTSQIWRPKRGLGFRIVCGIILALMIVGLLAMGVLSLIQ